MGETLRFSKAASADGLERLRRNDPQLCARIDDMLKTELERATSILTDDRVLIDQLTEELVVTGKLTPERVSAIETELRSRVHLSAVRSTMQKSKRKA